MTIHFIMIHLLVKKYNLFWALKITHILRGRHFDRDRGRGLAVAVRRGRNLDRDTTSALQ